MEIRKYIPSFLHRTSRSFLLQKAPLAFSLALLFSSLPLFSASVADFGAAGDGSTDDTQAFRDAIAHAGQNDGTVQIPPGRYVIGDDLDIDRAIQFEGSGHEESILTSNNGSTRLFVRISGTSFTDIGFENMVEPIALVSRSGYTLDNVELLRCRFEHHRVNNRNRGVIGLSSGNSWQRSYPIRNLVVEDCIFRDIDAHAINIRGNVGSATIRDNQFLDIENSRTDGNVLGGFAVRLGGGDGTTEVTVEQGFHTIEGNVVRNMRKHTRDGNLIGMLIYTDHSLIQNNLFEGIDGTSTGLDTNAMYIRGAYNEIVDNTFRDIRGADDDGALSFKGGLSRGLEHNVVSRNLFEDIDGMSAVEAHSHHLQFTENVIVNSSPRGFHHRGGTGLYLANNFFDGAASVVRTENGEVEVTGNVYIDARLWFSQRGHYPSDREKVSITDNLFRYTGHVTPLIRMGNDVEENFISIRENRFEFTHPDHGSGDVINLRGNGTLQKVEVIENHIVQNNSGTITFRLDSPEETVRDNIFEIDGEYTDPDTWIDDLGDGHSDDGGSGDDDGSGGGDDDSGGGDDDSGGGDDGSGGDDDSADTGPDQAEGLIAFYPLTEGSGDTAGDHSGYGTPLDLTLTGGASWLDDMPGVSFDGGAAKLQSAGSAAKLADQISATGEFSIEVWATTTDPAQSGPARMLSFSNGIRNRNFTLGQGGDAEDTADLTFRLRTTGTGDDNGLPNIQVVGAVAETPTHFVVTFDGETARIFRNGELSHSEERAGDLSNWDRNYPLVLGNEAGDDRGWAGRLHEVSIFDEPIASAEIQERYETATQNGFFTPPPIVPDDLAFSLQGAGSGSATWTSSPGQAYQLQYSENLTTWHNYGEPVQGDGSEIHLTDFPDGDFDAAFFRISVSRMED